QIVRVCAKAMLIQNNIPAPTYATLRHIFFGKGHTIMNNKKGGSMLMNLTVRIM
ncbi:unnamed protein product, partial [marine sediment metagenome]